MHSRSNQTPRWYLGWTDPTMRKAGGPASIRLAPPLSISSKLLSVFSEVGVKAFVDADFTFVNSRLARYGEVESLNSNEMQKFALQSERISRSIKTTTIYRQIFSFRCCSLSESRRTRLQRAPAP